MIWTLLNAVKELYHRFADHFDIQDRSIASMKAENAIKDQEINSLKQDNSQLKQDNAAIKAYLCDKDSGAAFCH